MPLHKIERKSVSRTVSDTAVVAPRFKREPLNRAFSYASHPESSKEGDSEANIADVASGTSTPVDAFAAGHSDGVHYKTMPWWKVGALMIAETISLGILALPHSVKTLGLVPGLFCLVFFGALSLYAGYVYGKFQENYPHIANISDAGGVLLGKPGQILFGGASVVVLVFIVAAHIGSFSIAMNVISGAATCSIVWAVLGTLISFACSLPRRLDSVSYLSVISCASIGLAALVCMISIAVVEPAKGDMQLFGSPNFSDGMVAILNIVLAYAGHVAFFGFIAESKEPKDFFKSVVMMQTVATSLYIIFSVVIYYFAGSAVMAPALSSASPTIRKVSYGLALPSIIIAGVINGHIAAKNVWIVMWRNNPTVITERTWRSVGSWTAVNVAAYFIAWVIAEAIPSFNQLLALVSALFMGFFSYGVTGIFWLYVNWDRKFSSRRMKAKAVVNILILVIGALLCIFGLIASIKGLVAHKGGRPFSCADNSK